MKIALAQINTTVGDFDGNLKKIRSYIKRARKGGGDLVVFPELSVAGYPPRDLLEQPHFVEKNLDAVRRLVPESKGIGILVGFAGKNRRPGGKPLFNAAAFLSGGRWKGTYNKQLLPTYDVFDEARYFSPGDSPGIFEFKGVRLGVTICEDIWSDFRDKPRYNKNPVSYLVKKKVECILNLSASPYGYDKKDARTDMIVSIAKKYRVPLLFCNLVGGNDELVFDGASLAVDSNGEIVQEGRLFEEELLFTVIARSPALASARQADGGTTWQSRSPRFPRRPAGFARDDKKGKDLPQEAEIFKALTLGLGDYVKKCGFRKVVLGLSGGVDSALTAVIAADALGPENVLGLVMPSRYSSPRSAEDALALAKNLGMETRIIDIDPLFSGYLATLAPIFGDLPKNEAEENIQARIRGNLLMAVSNKLGHLVLSTGNKSEISVGYCTLYGDMCGGLAVISDIPKTMVYRLARWINRDGEIIPKGIITKPPTAELRANQTDQDSLPPYDLLDDVLRLYVEDQVDREEIVAAGYKREVVDSIISKIKANEYKRRQMPVGIKVSKRAFGIGRRFPIARKG